MSRNQKAMLLSSKLVAADTYEMVIETKNAKHHATPGQFVHIQVPNRPDLLYEDQSASTQLTQELQLSL